MADDVDPPMPRRMPNGAKRAIEQVTSYRSWGAVDVYRALREALQQPPEYPEPPGPMPGSGAPPVQGR